MDGGGISRPVMKTPALSKRWLALVTSGPKGPRTLEKLPRAAIGQLSSPTNLGSGAFPYLATMYFHMEFSVWTLQVEASVMVTFSRPTLTSRQGSLNWAVIGVRQGTPACR